MSQFVNIPTSEWRRLCNRLSSIEECLKIITTTAPTRQWISEPAAMEMLGIKDKRTMRKKAADHHINFTSSGSRAYKYLHADLKNYLLKNSTLTNAQNNS